MYKLLILIFFVFVMIKINPKYSFWIAIFFATNPGGISAKYLSKGVIRGFSYLDIFLVLSYLIIFMQGYKIQKFFNNKLARKIFMALFFFSLYKVFIWGLFVPQPDLDYFFRYCIVRERGAIFTYLLIIPVYLFALKDLKILLKVILTSAFIIYASALVTILFGINILDVASGARYKGGSAMRYFLSGYGMLTFIIPTTISIYLLRMSIKNKVLILIGGIIGILNMILTLTKNIYLGLFWQLFSAVILSMRLQRKKIIEPIIILLIIGFLLIGSLNYLMPEYKGYSLRIFDDLTSLVLKGETTDGSTSRMWQVEALMYEFKRKSLLGTGQGYAQLNTQKFDQNQFDASDLPLLAHIMQYGIIGILIYLAYYYHLFNLIMKLFKRIKVIPIKVLVTDLKYELIFCISSIAFFAGYFGKGYMIFIELTNGTTRAIMTIYTAILLACLERIRLKLKQDNLIRNNNQ